MRSAALSVAGVIAALTPWMPWWGWVGLGLLLAGLTVGLVVVLVAGAVQLGKALEEGPWH